MKLVLYSSLSLGQMEDVVKNMFEQVPNYNIPDKKFLNIPFSEANLGKIWKVIPIKNYH